MDVNTHCRVKRYAFKREWLRSMPAETMKRACFDMDRVARRTGAAIVDKWYDIDLDMEWRELSYDPPSYIPTSVTFRRRAQD